MMLRRSGVSRERSCDEAQSRLTPLLRQQRTHMNIYRIIPLFLISLPLHAEPITLERVSNIDVSAGCFFSDIKTKEQIFIVAHRSRPNHIKGVAHIRFDGKQYALDLIEPHPKKINIYQAADIRVEISGWKQVAPFCKGSECEGAYYNVSMKIEKTGDSIRLKARAHCGA